MRKLPLADPGTPDHRTPARYLLWVASGQKATLAGGMFFGVLWMTSQAFVPAILGRAIDEGVAAGNSRRLLFWTLALAAVGVVQAGAGIMRHRYAVVNWLTGAYRTVQAVTRHSAELGATVHKHLATGEVVSVGASDLAHIGNVLEVSARFAGAIAAFVTVAIILLGSSTTLGLVVLIGVPVMLFCLGPMLKPLQRRQFAHRDAVGELNSLGSDIVAGLRVLRGIGGEDSFSRRYRGESQQVRAAGVKVARIQSTLDATQVLLPGVFVVIVVWIGARFALHGSLSPGSLVAFYGYATFLVMPLRTATEYADKLMRYAGGRVTFGGVALAAATRDDVRERILVSDTGAQLFTGVLREELDPDGGRDDDELMAAIRTA